MSHCKSLMRCWYPVETTGKRCGLTSVSCFCNALNDSSKIFKLRTATRSSVVSAIINICPETPCVYGGRNGILALRRKATPCLLPLVVDFSVQAFRFVRLSGSIQSMKATLRLKLQTDEATEAALHETLRQSTACFNAVCRCGWQHNERNGTR